MFHIKNNTLTSTESIYKHIKLESNNYIYTISYFGDYKADKNQKTLDKKAITTICKPKNIYAPTFKWQDNQFIFEMPTQNLFFEKELQDFQTMITIAIESKHEIETIFDTYFPKECFYENNGTLN